MQLHEIRSIHKNKRKKRVGRGGKHGTYSGRGIKGQKSRAGRRLKPFIRELIKRYPKLRGTKFKSWKQKPTIVNIEVLEGKFNNLEIVSPKSLIEKNIIRKIKGRLPEVKILGQGKINKKLTIKDCKISKGAKEKIEKAGGKILQ
jgi:large subunit ribosomal protein L15